MTGLICYTMKLIGYHFTSIRVGVCRKTYILEIYQIVSEMPFCYAANSFSDDTPNTYFVSRTNVKTGINFAQQFNLPLTVKHLMLKYYDYVDISCLAAYVVIYRNVWMNFYPHKIYGLMINVYWAVGWVGHDAFNQTPTPIPLPHGT